MAAGNTNDDIFDQIAMSEDREWKKGFDDGMQKGLQMTQSPVRHLGDRQGRETGLELGFYQSFACCCISDVQSSEKVKDQANILSNLAKLSPSNEALFDTLERCREAYKLLCSYLNIANTSPFSSEVVNKPDLNY